MNKSLSSIAVRAAVLLLLVAVTIALCVVGNPITASPETGVNMDLPTQVGEFVGTPQEISESERIILPEDTEFAKMLYTDPAGETVNTQIVLAGAERRSIHRPEVCLPGQGWTIKSSQTLEVPRENGSDIPVTLLRIARPIEVGGKSTELESLFLYWFVGKNTLTANHLVRVLKTNLDVLLTNTNHRWAYVICSAPVLAGLKPGGLDEPETLAMLQSFIGDIAPDIIKADAVDEPSS